MGLRGPRKQLPHIARLTGNPGRRPIIDSGIQAEGEPFIPDFLPPDARGCIGGILNSMPPGTYARADSYLLSAFAMTWAIHRRAAHEVSAPGFQHVIRSARGGQQPNPWIRILNQQAALLASLGDRLGLNPKARAALHAPDDVPSGKFEGLLGPLAGRRYNA